MDVSYRNPIYFLKHLNDANVQFGCDKYHTVAQLELGSYTPPAPDLASPCLHAPRLLQLALIYCAWYVLATPLIFMASTSKLIVLTPRTLGMFGIIKNYFY